MVALTVTVGCTEFLMTGAAAGSSMGARETSGGNIGGCDVYCWDFDAAIQLVFFLWEI